ncbi:MAG: right-handed parallel beta-helix repeat-containing protein [Hyphomicrobium sp.]
MGRTNGTPVSAAALAALIVLSGALAPTGAEAESRRGCVPASQSALTVDVTTKGARGDDDENDTAAIQRAIDAVAGSGGTVLVPRGRYMIDAETSLKLKSRMRLKLADDAILKVIPNGLESYSLLSVSGASDVVVEGGMLEGDRKDHSGKTGEWGMGIRVGGKSKNLVVSGTTIRWMWGDGIYLAGASNVKLCALTADHNRRQGLSVIAVDGLLVTNSLFTNTAGTRPATGIDFEPNGPTDTITNVRIENSKFLDNAGGGILVAGKRAEISGVEIVQNVFRGQRPIVIEHARKMSSGAICRNRYITPPAEVRDSLAGSAEAIPVVIVQDGCGDPRIVTRRGKGGKS